jgi:hypothetical protein
VKLLEVTKKEVNQEGEVYILCKAILTAESLDEKETTLVCRNCQQIVAWKGLNQQKDQEDTHWINNKIISEFILTKTEDVFSFDETPLCAKKARVVINEFKTVPTVEEEQLDYIGMGTSMPINVPMSLSRASRNEPHTFEPPHIYAAKTFDEKSSLSSRPDQRKFSVL